MKSQTLQFLSVLAHIFFVTNVDANLIFEQMTPHAFKKGDELRIMIGNTLKENSLRSSEYLDIPWCHVPEKEDEEGWFS